MNKTTTNGAATRAAKTSTHHSKDRILRAMDGSARLYQGKRKRDFTPMPVTIEGDNVERFEEMRKALELRYGLEPWQAESAILHFALKVLITGREAVKQ